jgi:hypothetical protein
MKAGRVCIYMEISNIAKLEVSTLISFSDSINIKILNAGAWARGSERVTVSLPLELEDYIPEVEDFYKKKHSGRKLQWYHHMSNGTVCIICRVQFMGDIYILMFLINTLRKCSDPKVCLQTF